MDNDDDANIYTYISAKKILGKLFAFFINKCFNEVIFLIFFHPFTSLVFVEMLFYASPTIRRVVLGVFHYSGFLVNVLRGGVF